MKYFHQFPRKIYLFIVILTMGYINYHFYNIYLISVKLVRCNLLFTSCFAGLAFDDWDLDFYTELFVSRLKRDPTSVECFDLAQSNSEHSRHWFFKGRINLDGKEQPRSLIDLIIDTQNYSNPNNVIKFADNSSAIEGFKVALLRPTKSYESSNFHLEDVKQHLIFTAETHNFPTGVAPFR